MKKRILVTGCAGFIGSNLTDRLLELGYEVIGLDNFNDFYDPKMKEANLSLALRSDHFTLYRQDILDLDEIRKIFIKEKPDKIIHLAARGGVRSSIVNPLLYAEVNTLGTVKLLKLAVDSKIEQFIFGSSSSVYGNSRRLPFSEDDPCENIVSPYGASKRSAEFFVETFSRLHGLKPVVLRFFTVYGPRGRPDMAPAIFTKAIVEGRQLQMFGDGSSSRDYTCIDDVVDGIVKALEGDFNFEIINLGNNNPVNLRDFIGTLERITGKRALVAKLPKVAGDVQKTWANIEKAKKLLSWKPVTKLEDGLRKYLNWYQSRETGS